MEKTLISSKARFVLLIVCVLALSGCANKIETPPVEAQRASNIDWEAYMAVLADDNTPLTRVEMEALLEEGEIDKDITPVQMKEVQKYYKHYLHTNRKVIERFMMRAQNLLPYTKQVFKERGLPEDLAYLAFVESGYNHSAVSRSKAVGLWQFMAPTGRHYGLTQDSWVDERLDPYEATEAAADYLTKLYGDFKDWGLAIAAYNAGEGKIGRALAGTGSDSFFDLLETNYLLDEKRQLKNETQEYVPRFLAMTKIMRHADKLGFSPAQPEPKDTILQPVEPISAPPGTDLVALSQAIGMPWDTFSAHNSAFKRAVTPPDRYCNVYVPAHLTADAQSALMCDTGYGGGWKMHTVAKGESLSSISKKTGVSVQALRQTNLVSEPLKVGTQLRIPSSAPATTLASTPKSQPQPVAAPKKQQPVMQTAQVKQQPVVQNTKPAVQNVKVDTPKPVQQPVKQQSVTLAVANYSVKKGDTLASIARTSGVSLTELRRMNPQLASSDIKIGQNIVVPKSSSVVAEAPSTPPSQQKEHHVYTVQSGDTLWAIARKFNVAPDELLAWNDMTRESTIRPGDAVKIKQR